MRASLVGFAAGTLTLVVLYALLQNNSAKAITAGSGALVGLLHRAFAADVAGVQARKAAPPAASSSGPAPDTGPPVWVPGEVV